MLEHYNALAEGGVRAHERDSETFRDALLNSPEQAINIVYRSAYRNGDVALDKADTFLTQFVSSMSLFYDLMESLLAETGAQRELRRVRFQRYPDELLAGKEMADIDRAGAYLETTDSSYQFAFSGKVKKDIRNNQPAIDINFESQSWVKKN